MRFRKSIVVGFMRISPSEMVGNSRGNPPADHAPRFTASATCRRWALQLVSSDQELDTDHGAAVEDEIAEPLRLEPRAVDEAVEVVAPEPVAAPERVCCHGNPPGHRL